MAKNRGSFLIDDSVKESDRTEIADRIKTAIDKVSKTDNSERETILRKRKDFFEGRHHLWTNVVGQTLKQQEGHIQAAFNYILKFSQKVHQSLTNSPPKLKIKPEDESNEIETLRAEAVEKAVYKVLEDPDNEFFKKIFKRSGMNQVRDGDFAIECKVVEDSQKGKHIEISHSEDLNKIHVLWDDASGSSFTGIAFKDQWSLTKIKRDFDYDAEPIAESKNYSNATGSHNDQYGIFAGNNSSPQVPSGRNSLPKADVTDYWGYEVIDKELKVVNIIWIGKDVVQFVKTDYKIVPKFIGHSFASPGSPWSMAFADPLIDPQIELNDRTGEEGDLVRVGAHMKFVVVNMGDFDPKSIKPGSGQLIFLEGENVDFRPLPMNISTFPSDTYLNRNLEHMFNLGIPKITLAAGTAPYTGRVGAIQYQPFADIINELRIQWEIVMKQLIISIQQYFIDYFPELAPIMAESISDEETGETTDGEPIIRSVEFDWDNILPLSRSDKVVDAATLRDRGILSLSTTLEEAGFRNPGEEIKKLKKEIKDPDLMTIREKFTQFSPGVVSAQLDARKAQMGAEEQAAEDAAALAGNPQPTPKSTPPLLSPEQNSGRRGTLSGSGTPNGQGATPRGNVANTSQNINNSG